jgi:hypothetical protein
LLAPKESAATQATRERSNSNALQNLFAPAPTASVPAPPALNSPASQTGESAWPRALAEAFTPLLPPFSANGGEQGQNQKAPQPADTQQPHASSHAPAVPQTNQQPSGAPSSRELLLLRAEAARLELLVKKVQTELQLEREYNQALEKQIQTLINTN